MTIRRSRLLYLGKVNEKIEMKKLLDLIEIKKIHCESLTLARYARIHDIEIIVFVFIIYIC